MTRLRGNSCFARYRATMRLTDDRTTVTVSISDRLSTVLAAADSIATPWQVPRA